MRVATSSVDETLEERGRQVTLTGVGDDGDDRLAGELRASGHLTGSLQGTTAGDAGDDSLLGCSTTGKADGVLTAHQQNLVDDGLVEVVRHEARPPSLDLVGGLLTLGDDRRLGRLGPEHLDLGVLLLEVLASTRDGAASADAGDDGVNRAVGVVPDLLAGAVVMDRRVGRVSN